MNEFKDHIVQYPDKYTMTTNPDGTVTLRPTWVDNPEEVLQEGTPINAETLNGIVADFEIADINFSKYEPVGNGIADDSAKLQQALDELPDGGTLFLGGSDKVYRLNSTVSIAGKTVHLKANGATIMQGFNNEIFRYTGLFGTPVNITAITTESATFGDSGGTVVSKVTAPGHTLIKGDVVKIVSDDLIVGRRQATARSGEYQVVQLISGNDIFLSGKLRTFDSYATNPRIVKHMDKTITIDGVNWTSAPESFANNWSFGLIAINGAFKPIIRNTKIKDVHGPAYNMIGCYAYRIDNLTAQNLTNQPSLSRYGYGINDKSSEYGVCSNLHFENVRHGYTNNANTVTAGSNDFWRYGRPAYFIVQDSTAIGCTNSAYDNHEEAVGGQFVNCTARGMVKGNSSSGAGFTARGKQLRYDNCRVYDSAVGFQIISTYAGDTDDILMNDCETNGITTSSFSIVQGTTGSRIKKINIVGGRYHTIGNFINAVGAKVNVRNVDIDAPFESAGLNGPLRINSSDLYMDEVRIDMSGSTSTNIQVVKVQDSSYPGNWSIKGRRVEVRLADGVNYFARADGQDASLIRISDLVLSRAIALTSNFTGTADISWSLSDSAGMTINSLLKVTGITPKLQLGNSEMRFDGTKIEIGMIVSEVMKQLVDIRAGDIIFVDTAGESYGQFNNNPANGFSGLRMKYRADSVTKYNPIQVGAVDSGGTGFRSLRIPN